MTDGYEDRATRARLLGSRARECASEAAIENALQLEQEATEIWRSLADEKPDAFSIDLAKSLSSLISRFAQLNRPAQAFKAAKESAGLWRQLSENSPGQYERYLAHALSAWGTFQLSTTKKPVEVYPISADAVRVWRSLCERDPTAFRLQLASSLLFHYRIGNGARRPEMEILEEATCHWRRLASEDFARHGFQLVTCLDLLAFEFSAAVPGSARWKASLAARREAKRTRLRFYGSRLRLLLRVPRRRNYTSSLTS